MTTEREMLEFAAKACGIEVKPMEMNNVECQGDYRFIGLMADVEQWPRGWFNPITSSADCAAMCAKLKIGTLWISGMDAVQAITEDWDESVEYFKDHNNDREAAWRLAATRVAYEIGKGM